MGMGGQRYASAALPPGKKSGNHYMRGWVGPRARLDGCVKSCPPPSGIRSPDRPDAMLCILVANHQRLG